MITIAVFLAECLESAIQGGKKVHATIAAVSLKENGFACHHFSGRIKLQSRKNDKERKQGDVGKTARKNHQTAKTQSLWVKWLVCTFILLPGYGGAKLLQY